jgi:hypothetical protein
MNTIEAYYDGHSFVPLVPIQVKKNQKAVVTLLDETIDLKAKHFLDVAGILSKEEDTNILHAIERAEKIDNEW